MLQLYIKMLAPLLARQTGPGRACSPSEGRAAGERAEETHRISKKARARPRRSGCTHSTACTRGRHNYRKEEGQTKSQSHRQHNNDTRSFLACTRQHSSGRARTTTLRTSDWFDCDFGYD